MGTMNLPSPANDASHSPDDIRDQLRRDHESVLAELDGLRGERDQRRAEKRLRGLRQAWVIHALAEETVVYRALESVQSSERADERFVEHELVGDLFDKIGKTRCGTLERNARINVARELIQRHIQSEEADMLVRLERHFSEEELREMGERFRLAHQKLALLESAKAA
jgi:hemerythrin superfamily protein